MILVSAFQKFNGDQLNASEEVLRQLTNVEKILLPVTFAESWIVLRSRLQENPPEVLLLLGQAKGRAKINLEKLAVNLIDSEISDEAGQLIQDVIIDKDGEAALLSNVDLHKTKSLLAVEHVQISYSAGAFVCNFLYYQALVWCLQRGIKVLFIHLPIIPEQAQAGVDLAHLKLSDQVKCIQNLIELFDSKKI